MGLFVGVGGAARNACVTVCTPDRILGICEQERITRVRAAGLNATGLPDEALDLLLRRSGRRREEIAAYAFAEDVPGASRLGPVQLDHHFAHAAAAFLPSPFETAAIVICDHESPQVSVWSGAGQEITRIDWPWQGPGFAELYSKCAAAFGFGSTGGEQRLEALARLNPSGRDDRVNKLFTLHDDRVECAPNWEACLEGWTVGAERKRHVSLATSVQSRLGDLLLEFLSRVRQRVPTETHLCVGGSLFSNSYLNSRVKLDGGFSDVFIPINPGNAGLSLGTALHVSRQARQSVTPFFGPSFSSEEVKATLDNCKLTYEWASEPDTIGIAVDALSKGRLVAFFDGAMEWGPRALGARSILANPSTQYALDNLNRFLKQRETWRGYALSGLESAVADHFEGPAASPFMECDYQPRSPEFFREVLPEVSAAVRVQTVGASASPRFRTLLRAFQDATRLPAVVNTSFNGFSEPIVCNPRDAVRVFFGTGIDMLVFDQFVLSK